MAYDPERIIFRLMKSATWSHSRAQQAADGFMSAKADLISIGVTNDARIAALIGQCAHESVGFKHTHELLSYRSTGLMRRVFKRLRHKPESELRPLVRNPEAFGNYVYANINGNGDQSSGDGFRYCGKGYLQLTGRANYRECGRFFDFDLEGHPHLAEDMDWCWRAAAWFLSTQPSSRISAFHYADAGNHERVGRIVNGGTNGEDDRLAKTNAVRSTLYRAITIREWQTALAAKGFDPGIIDGLNGPKTRRARFQAYERYGLNGIFLYETLIGPEAPPSRVISTRQWQVALNEAGIPAGPSDGIMGRLTRAAIDRAEELYSKSDAALYDHLVSLEDDLDMREWQQLLSDAGFDPGPIDGWSGPRTRAAQDAAWDVHNLMRPALIDALKNSISSS